MEEKIYLKLSDKIVISDSKNFICISICRENDEVMSWEYLQGVKDKYYPNLDFIEIYPCGVSCCGAGSAL